MGATEIKADTVTGIPHVRETPFFPPGNHPPTKEEIDQMITSRLNLAFDQLVDGANERNKKQNVYRAVGVGVAGLAVGVAGTMLVGRIVRGRRARAAANGQ